MEKQNKDLGKACDELKEALYEWENKYTEKECEMEDQKATFENMNSTLKKDLKHTKDHEADLTRKYDKLKAKYDSDCQSLKVNMETEKSQSEQRVQQAETQLKETQDQYEMAKGSWDKEKAVLA